MPTENLKGMDHAKVFRSELDVHKHIANVNGRQVKLPKKSIVPKYNAIQYRVTGLEKGKTNRVVLPVLNYGENHSMHGIKTQVSARGETVVTFVPKGSTQLIEVYVK